MSSVNKVLLLGNLTRNPEMKHTEGKKPVCIFGLATNRTWADEKEKSTKSQSTTGLWPGINCEIHRHRFNGLCVIVNT
jgi:single stranded DNA-binding protein